MGKKNNGQRQEKQGQSPCSVQWRRRATRPGCWVQYLVALCRCVVIHHPAASRRSIGCNRRRRGLIAGLPRERSRHAAGEGRKQDAGRSRRGGGENRNGGGGREQRRRGQRECGEGEWSTSGGQCFCSRGRRIEIHPQEPQPMPCATTLLSTPPARFRTAPALGQRPGSRVLAAHGRDRCGVKPSAYGLGRLMREAEASTGGAVVCAAGTENWRSRLASAV